MSRTYADATWYAVQGPAADLDDWVGREITVEAPYPVNEAQIAYFAAMLEDPNENYWDAAAAKARYGAIISPPAMLKTWMFPLPWQPGGPPEQGPLMALEIPLPGETLINVSTEATFLAPMRVGDRLSLTDRVEAISPLKRTAVGVGYFVTTRAVCRNQDGLELATNTNVIYRYEAAEGGEGAGDGNAKPAAQAGASEAPEGTERLEEIVMPASMTRIVLGVAATRDFFRGHHDTDYARGQGTRDAYFNTMFLQGLVDRAGQAWAGDDAWLTRRQLRMLQPACRGDTLRTDGWVRERREQDGRRLADLRIDVRSEVGLTTTTQLTFDLDGWAGGDSA
ncbi:MAG: MaoC family dehydratase N-terminal domain-containing protein [Alphaproteobacteria bacterium]|jgi:acyl dehydratase|nr:MaoC family dehydratase N-terminal domain-containing protein [Alphaproteobacteria bacterium]